MSQFRRIDAPLAGRRPALLLAALGLLTAPAAGAAGFGQLRLQSHLGQPLQAEIDIAGVAPADADALAIALAPPDDYARAGLPYPAALAGARWQLERRADGGYVARLRSSEPVAEPFVDLLVQLTWPGGKAVRSYTVLLDPQDRDAAPAEPAGTSATDTVTTPMVVQPEGAGDADTGTAATGPSAARSPVATAPSRQPERAYTVQRGDHLYGIASSLMPAGDAVSLDQMVVALFRANPRAFIAGNMNRLKAGAVLKLPDQGEAGAISAGEARRELVAHTQAFDAYRNRLAQAAAAAVTEPGDGQQQAGRITARVEDGGLPATGPRDELKLSKPEQTAAQGVAAASVAGAEDEVARQRQLRDAEQRLAQLRKNVDDIQRLLELKSTEMARLDGAAGEGATGPSAAPPLPAAPAAAGPASATAASAARPSAQATPGAWLGGPWVLPLGGALIALLAGYGLYRRQRRRAAFAARQGGAPSAIAAGPLALDGFSLPLNAFPAPDPGFAPPPRHPVADSDEDAGQGSGGGDGNAAGRSPAHGAPPVQRPLPAFDLGTISLDLDPSDVTPVRDDAAADQRRDGGNRGAPDGRA